MQLPTHHVFINTQITTVHQFTLTRGIIARIAVLQQELAAQDAAHPLVLVQLPQALATTNTATIYQTAQNTTTQDTTTLTADQQQGHALQDAVIIMDTVPHPCLTATTLILITTLTLPNIITTTTTILPRLSLPVEPLLVLLWVVLSDLLLSLA